MSKRRKKTSGKVPCPNCGCDLYLSGDVRLYEWVLPERDREGLARADLILECDECHAEFNAFVPLKDFHPIAPGMT